MLWIIQVTGLCSANKKEKAVRLERQFWVTGLFTIFMVRINIKVATSGDR